MIEYQLAEALHKFVWEIRMMPASEFDGWLKYFEWKDKHLKKQQNNQKNKSGKKLVI